jgi:uncharacterized membrane protein
MDDQEERDILEKLLHLKYEQLGEQEKKVAHHFTARAPISKDTAKEFEDRLTFGQRLADRVAAFGGSWTFISIFGGVLLLWILLNAFLLMESGKTFDPYPYILLNLVLIPIRLHRFNFVDFVVVSSTY